MTRDAFDDLLDRSAPTTREPLVRLVHWERFSIAEAAEVLGVPASTARGRYTQAKDVLRAALDAGIVVPGR